MSEKPLYVAPSILVIQDCDHPNRALGGVVHLDERPFLEATCQDCGLQLKVSLQSILGAFSSFQLDRLLELKSRNLFATGAPSRSAPRTGL